MKFPNSGSGRPFVRIDGRSGTFALSCLDGDPEIFEMKGRLLDLDLAGADQGWLKLSIDGADWVALDTIDDWDNPPQPSAEHAPGVRIDLMCADWPEPKVRELRGSSRAITRFIAGVAEDAGDVSDGMAVRIRINGARVRKFGKGSSAEINFDIAPRDRWPSVATFDAHRDAADTPEDEPIPAAAPPAGGGWGASDGAMADEAIPF